MIVAMGSMTQTIEEVVDALNVGGEKVGLLTVHLYRPYSLEMCIRDRHGTAAVSEAPASDRSQKADAGGKAECDGGRPGSRL